MFKNIPCKKPYNISHFKQTSKFDNTYIMDKQTWHQCENTFFWSIWCHLKGWNRVSAANVTRHLSTNTDLKGIWWCIQGKSYITIPYVSKLSHRMKHLKYMIKGTIVRNRINAASVTRLAQGAMNTKTYGDTHWRRAISMYLLWCLFSLVC